MKKTSQTVRTVAQTTPKSPLRVQKLPSSALRAVAAGAMEDASKREEQRK